MVLAKLFQEVGQLSVNEALGVCEQSIAQTRIGRVQGSFNTIRRKIGADDGSDARRRIE